MALKALMATTARWAAECSRISTEMQTVLASLEAHYAEKNDSMANSTIELLTVLETELAQAEMTLGHTIADMARFMTEHTN